MSTKTTQRPVDASREGSTRQSASSNEGDHLQSRPLHIPDSPAPRGYHASPYREVADEAHRRLEELLHPSASWEATGMQDGVDIYIRPRTKEQPISSIPTSKGTTFIPDSKPIEILACIHLFSYRLIWDTRMSSGRIIQRYGYHHFLFYTVYRGIGQVYAPRDASGIQDIRCWDANRTLQRTATADTEKIDIVYRSVETSDIPIQEGKVRMHIDLGAYRIIWKPELQGCEVTFVGLAELGTPVPTYMWKVFSKELPRVVGRLRGSMERFGVPPYVVDAQDCVVIQTTFYYSQLRKATFRHHVRRPGSYVILYDRRRMYPMGIAEAEVTGEGADAVQVEDDGNQLLVTVASAEGVGKEYVITLLPSDAETEPTSLSEWW